MVRFRCIACSRECEVVHDPERRECRVCSTADEAFALDIEELLTRLSRRWVGPSRMKTKLTRIDVVLLWILSDIHLELTRGWDLPPPTARPRFDALVVAGDLVPRMDRGVRWLRERVPDEQVIYVAGNRQSVEAVARRLEEMGYLDRAAIDELLKRYPVRNEQAGHGALE